MTPAPHKTTDSQARTNHADPTAAGDARRTAYEALLAAGQRPVFVSRVLEDQFAEQRLTRSDRRFATELANGVTRRRLTLDTLLACFLSRPLAEIETGLQTLLRLGVYQLVLIDVPDHAAVHETVELAKRIGKPRWVGFLNGVLRSVLRALRGQYATAPAATAVPIIRLKPSLTADPELEIRYRQLRTSSFADPRQDFAGYLSQGFSLPRWLVERWVSDTHPDQILRRCAWFDTPGRMSLRVNPLQTDRERLLEVLHTAGVDAAAGRLPDIVNLAGTVRVEDIPGFAEGWFSVQDESAVHAGLLLDPQPGERILDLCAAPGGKTTHLAERMHDTGQIIATDISPERLARVDESAERLGLTCIHTCVIQADGSDLPAGPFDGVLVDVPCSNTGVLGKRPEARWRASPDGIRKLAQLQQQLLTTTVDRIGSAGRIVYSTCSIESEENEHVVRNVLAEHPRLELVSERRHTPGSPTDGGYQALLRIRNL
jgi:16S rRNA (cytosine967-C5)-methyltransferase